MNMRRILIIGYFGDRNTGDEAVLTAMLGGLKASRINLEVIVPTYGSDPGWLEAAYGVTSFPFRHIDRMFDSVEAADLVLLGGGGLLHDIWHPRPETMLTSQHFGLSYYCGIPWLAAQLGKPVMLYAVGVGPLLFKEGEDLVRDVASVARVITVRDSASAELLRKLGVEASRVQVTADPTWQLVPPHEEVANRLLARAGVSPGRRLGVAVRNWNLGVDQSAWEKELLAGVEAFARKHSLGVLFVPFQHGESGLQDDVGLARKLSAKLSDVRSTVLEHPRTPEELLGVIGKCDLMVSMRLHSFIFACKVGTPAVVLDYDPKVPLHAATLKPPPPIIKVTDLTSDSLQAALNEVWNERTTWPHRQRVLASRMRQRAARNNELALSLLDSPSVGLPRNSYQRIFDLLRAREASRTSGTEQNFTVLKRASFGRVHALRDAEPDFVHRIRRVVRIIAPQFFDTSGTKIIFGGAERYLIELVRVIRGLGYEVEVLQPADGDAWVRYYRDVRVVGVKAHSYFDIERTIYQSGARRPLLTIHLAFHSAGPDTIPPAIGISHGVYWDDPYYRGGDRLQWQRESVLEPLEYLDAVVSVDTNTINWVSASSPRLAEKLVYIPNFVDMSQFHPEQRDDSRVVIMFPRRLAAPKGFWLMAEIAPGLLADHPEIEVRFIGDASGEEEKEILRLISQYAGRIKWDSLPPDRMPEAYRAADIVLIPTVYAEGTSFSCLEAQASGKPVIATRVGGLPDLILNEYNGLLVEPNAAAVRAAIERLLLDRPLLERLAEKALDTARSFRIERWRERWEDILRTYLPSSGSARRKARRMPLTAVFPADTEAGNSLIENMWSVAQELARHGVDTYWVDRDASRLSGHPRLQVLSPEKVLYFVRPLAFLWRPEQERWLDRLEQPEVVRVTFGRNDSLTENTRSSADWKVEARFVISVGDELGNFLQPDALWRTVLRPIVRTVLKEGRRT